MSTDNYVSVDRVIQILQKYEGKDFYIRDMTEAEATILWKNPRTGGLIYVGRVDLFSGKSQGGLVLDNSEYMESSSMG